MKRRYLVTVYSEGRLVTKYRIGSLKQVVVVKFAHRRHDIAVTSLADGRPVTWLDVAEAVDKAVKHWEVQRAEKAPAPKPKKEEAKKLPWKVAVRCIEDDVVFPTIKACSEYYKLPYKAVWNSINNGTSRKGLHFERAKEGTI